MKILLVDDEQDILEILEYNLLKEGYITCLANSGADALKKVETFIPDLVVLDIMMPEMDGIETCEKLKQNIKLKDTLIVFLSARSEDYTQIVAYETGADDYIVKPIKPRLFVSKIKAILNRNKTTKSYANISNEVSFIDLGFMKIDKEEFNVTYKDKVINLPKKEFELLFLLATKPNKVFKRNEILETVWGNDVIVNSRTIDVHMSKLREKIDENLFVTIKGVGYKLNL
jgi:two-component system, OmpR family, alkaline phosphatase synthesis response regulator PhoP